MTERAAGRALRIGIDVGGTNTDGVILEGRTVLAKTKAPTSHDVTSGIRQTLSRLIGEAGTRSEEIVSVMIGTTHFTNAFVHGQGLCSVAIVRLCLPATQAVPPLIDWPTDALERFTMRAFLCCGGFEFDGRVIADLDEHELRRVAGQIRDAGLESVAVTGVHSPVDPSQELRVAQIFAEELPGVPVSLSYEIGRAGLLERENATIVNAALRPLAKSITAAFRDAILSEGIAAPVYISQNDGTLATTDFTERYPVSTFTSGPTNSMRGAAFLSGLDDALVVDIGGTTTDIGALQSGFPRQTSVEALVGGVRTNFRLPDVVSLGIGGGSVVAIHGDRVDVGPRSVGYAIRERALVFGGNVTTATDIAVASGRADVGDPSLVSLDPASVARALSHIDDEVAAASDRMRASAAPLPIVLVGGGSVLLGDSLPGARGVHRPEHYEVANAVGAAIAQVSGGCEKVFALARVPRGSALAEAKEEARAAAVAAGADPGTVEIVDIEEIPMAYLPEGQTRFKVRAVGDLMVGEAHALHR